MASRKKKDYMKLLTMTDCNICHLELSDPRRIECGHVFCLHCLDQHVRSSSSCPTCKRSMEPKLGKVANYPVASEIVHLLRSLQKVASCGHIKDGAGSLKEGEKNEEDEDQYEVVDANQDEANTKTLPPQSKSMMSNEVCDLHGQRLVSVCTTCDDELICAKCSIHSTHIKIQISEHNKHLERLLEKQKADLLQREKDDEAEEENVQEMIEKQVHQRETIKDEIEEIADVMFTHIHMKKEEMLRPIEEKSDDYVKQLTERQEHIKDRISEFSHISNRIEKLSKDDTTDYSRKAKRLVKQANIALQIETKPVPPYQNIAFIRRETVLEDLSKLQLGDVKIDKVSIAQDEDNKASDFLSREEDEYAPVEENMYENSCTTPPPSVKPKPQKYAPVEENMNDDSCTPPPPSVKPKPQKYAPVEENMYDDSCTPQPPSVKPKPQKYNMPPPRRTTSNRCEFPLRRPMPPPPDTNEFPSCTRPGPPLPLKPQKQSNHQTPKEEKIYHDLEDYLYVNTSTLSKQIHDMKPAVPTEQTPDSHFNPPPLSPFSGTFRKSSSIAVNNRAFPQKLLHRVFLPFRPSGFTVVRGFQENYYTFVTESNNVQMFRQNGDFYRAIPGVVQPFDAASQQHGELLTPLYITDGGRRTGDGSVKVYTPEGEFQKILVGRLKKPQGISISRVGLVYVCDEANILVFCPKTGKKKRVISAIGKDPIFVRPLYVMVSATGKILVSDVGTRELKIHDETRKYTDKFKPDEDEGELYTSFTPGMCAEDPSSSYYVIDQERNMLYILRGAGKSERLALPSKPQGHDGIPTAVSFASDTGNIIVF